MPLVVMPKFLLVMMLMVPPILLIMMLAPQTPKIPTFNEKFNYTPDAADDDSVSPYDVVSPDCLINSKLKRTI